MAVPNRIQRAKTLVKRDSYAKRNREANEASNKEEKISQIEHEGRVKLLKQLGLIKEVKDE